MPTHSALEAPKGRSLTQDALRRLSAQQGRRGLDLRVRRPSCCSPLSARISLPWAYDKIDWAGIRKPPNLGQGHYFGTDQNGRDMLARTHAGHADVAAWWPWSRPRCRWSSASSMAPLPAISAAGSTPIMMRFVDIMYALPYILFVIILVVIFGRSPVLLFVGIGCLEWLTMARIVRGQTLSPQAARVHRGGQGRRRGPFTIIFRHIVPNLTGPVVIYATLDHPRDHHHRELPLLSRARRAGAADLARHADLVRRAGGRSAALDAAGTCRGVLVTMLLCLSYIGDGLRDALDPKDR